MYKTPLRRGPPTQIQFILLNSAHFCQDKLQIKDMSEVALIQIRAVSLSTGYAVAFVSLKGCLHPMPMDFSGLLRRLLTDCHIDFTSFKGGALACRWISPACCAGC